MIVKIKNTRFDVTYITDLERLMYFQTLKYSKGIHRWRKNVTRLTKFVRALCESGKFGVSSHCFGQKHSNIIQITKIKELQLILLLAVVDVVVVVKAVLVVIAVVIVVAVVVDAERVSKG